MPLKAELNVGESHRIKIGNKQRKRKRSGTMNTKQQEKSNESKVTKAADQTADSPFASNQEDWNSGGGGSNNKKKHRRRRKHNNGNNASKKEAAPDASRGQTQVEGKCGREQTSTQTRNPKKQNNGNANNKSASKDTKKKQSVQKGKQNSVISSKVNDTKKSVGATATAENTAPTNRDRYRVLCPAENVLKKHMEQNQTLYNSSRLNTELVDLPKEAINNLPPVPYKDTKTTVVISNAKTSEWAVSVIRSQLAEQQKLLLNGSKRPHHEFQYLGFDTETRPKYQKGGDDHPPALIQLATNSAAYLFRISFQGMDQYDSAMTSSLFDLLCDPTIVKVGIGIHKDVEDLKQVYGASCGGDMTSYLDLAPLVRVSY